MANLITISEGLDLRLPGAADFGRVGRRMPASCTLFASDYPGALWVPVVEKGMKVSAGAALAHARMWPDVCLVTPVSGVVDTVACDDCGALEYVRVTSDVGSAAVRHEITQACMPGLREALITLLGRAGIWALMRRLPYCILPDPDVVPRDIFVTAFDSAPLAGPLVTAAMLPALETGIEALSALTSGRVYLGVPYDSDISSRAAVVTEFQGPHPAGNPGIQAGLTLPVSRGETVWTLDARTVVRIGRLLTTGVPDLRVEVTVAGEAAMTPCIIETYPGASLSDTLVGHLPETPCRIISGNPLSGFACDVHSGALRYPFRQISLLPEITDNVRGGLWRRVKACMSPKIENIFPLDINCERLLEAVEALDPVRMEAEGIYEVAPEDFSVMEYTDPRHRLVQKMVLEGIKFMQAYESGL